MTPSDPWRMGWMRKKTMKSYLSVLMYVDIYALDIITKFRIMAPEIKDQVLVCVWIQLDQESGMNLSKLD